MGLTAEQRWDKYFKPLAKIDIGELTEERSKAMHAFLKDNIRRWDSTRVWHMQRTIGTLSRYYAAQYGLLSESWDRTTFWYDAAEAAADGEQERFSSIVEKGLEWAVERTSAFDEAETLIKTRLVLLHESGLKFGVAQITGMKSLLDDLEEHMDKAGSNAQIAKAREDARLMQQALAKDPALDEAIRNRENKLGLSKRDHAKVKQVLQEELYDKTRRSKNPDRAIARKLSTELSGKMKRDIPPDQVKHTLVRWARTEATAVQNDALMIKGREAELEGKVWVSMRDSLVRQLHAANDAAGIIPIDATFPDGSSDAGSGSVSPWNCRCLTAAAPMPKRIRS